jgi:hypothetical protein
MWLILLHNCHFYFCIEDGCGSKSTDADLNGVYSYIFASMLASSGVEQMPCRRLAARADEFICFVGTIYCPR